MSPRRRAGLVAVATLLAAALGAPARADGDPVDSWRRELHVGKLETRVEAARAATRTVRALSAADRARVTALFTLALRTEPEDSVRLEEVRALAAIDEALSWVPVLVVAMGERDAPSREEARRLAILGKAPMLDAAARLLKEDDSPTFRADLVLLLGRRRRLDAAPTLLVALSDPHPRVVAAAAEALEAVSGQPLGFDAKAWQSWWAKQAPSPAPSMGDVVTREPDAPTVPPPPPPAKGLVPAFYGLPLASKDLVFVIDVSGSIGAGGLESAKGELARAIERLSSDVHVAALFFDETVHAWHPETVPATPEMKEDLAKFVRGIARGKRTDVMTPLNAGLQIVRNRIEARAKAHEVGDPVTMIVASDGQENLRATPGETVGDKLDRLDLSQAVVHAIVLGGRDNALLAALARRGGGRYLVVP